MKTHLLRFAFGHLGGDTENRVVGLADLEIERRHDGIDEVTRTEVHEITSVRLRIAPRRVAHERGPQLQFTHRP